MPPSESLRRPASFVLLRVSQLFLRRYRFVLEETGVHVAAAAPVQARGAHPYLLHDGAGVILADSIYVELAMAGIRVVEERGEVVSAAGAAAVNVVRDIAGAA